MISMSTIEVNKDQNENVVASLLPFQIQYNGDINTLDYFTPSKLKESNNNDNKLLDIAYFRGRKLVGETIDLEKINYMGYIITKSEYALDNSIENEENIVNTEMIQTANKFTSVANFDKLTVYGHDSLVKSTDQWNLIPEFIKVNKILNED
ncbi:unnamed protein product [Candida verbasci]|uniref:Uncharacterized protein n=1 Tax=Candida verbasci TaxID=1227364 RepID=A0A9W4XBI9_9ASCO|nr:unnamed protein product [Candida verbasci]